MRYGPKAVPTAAAAAASLAGVTLRFIALADCIALPCLTLNGGASAVSGDHAIARHILRVAGRSDLLGGGGDDLTASHVDQWLDACLTHSGSDLAPSVERHLQLNTYLAGHSLTLADAVVAAKLSSGSSSERWRSDGAVASAPVRAAGGDSGSQCRACRHSTCAGGRQAHRRRRRQECQGQH